MCQKPGQPYSNEIKEMFDIISEQNLIGIVILQQNTIKYANAAWAEITGYSREEICGRDLNQFTDRIHPDDRSHLLEQMERKLSGNPDHKPRYDWRLITKSGDIRWIAMYSRPTVYQSDNAIFATLIDITENKKIVRALEENEEKYRFLIDNATDAIFIAQDERVKFLNPESIQMTGYSEEEIMEMPFLNLIHPEDREMVTERHISRLRGETVESTYSFRVVTKSGEEMWSQLNATLITWQGRPATLNIVRDITQQKQIEERLLHAHKLESIGTLAGGIAHDFNNILMGIQGYASLTMAEIGESSCHFGNLKRIETLVKNAAQLTGQLLGFARKGKYQAIPSDLNQILDNSAEMFGRTKKEIVIKKNFAPKLKSVEVDRRQIEQVLLNLFVNAGQAMPDGGELHLRTENVTLDDAYAGTHDVEPGAFVRLSVRDTGIGMDEKTMKKIFDPFFTTKEIGRGTGLGLASAYGIIKNHGGIINVHSNKGIGSTFYIYLPATEKTEHHEVKIDTGFVKGSGNVLLVDDEQIIIDVGRRILEKIGYTVFLAKSGAEALAVIEEKGDDIDIVILDLVMPGMGGGEVFDKIKKIRPSLRVLLSSGYSENGEATEILNRGCNGFIQKPFTMSSIAKKVNELLEA